MVLNLAMSYGAHVAAMTIGIGVLWVVILGLVAKYYIIPKDKEIKS